MEIDFSRRKFDLKNDSRYKEYLAEKKRALAFVSIRNSADTGQAIHRFFAQDGKADLSNKILSYLGLLPEDKIVPQKVKLSKA